MKAVRIAAVSVLLPLAMATVPGAQAQGDELYYELQLLRDEIRQMSGRIEELDHELGRLKQRQQEDYRDLDRRISPDPGGADVTGADVTGAIGTQGGAGSAPVLLPSDSASSASATDPQSSSRDDQPAVAGAPLIPVDDPATPTADPRADREQYEEAYDLLRRRRMDESAQAFQAYVNEYPQGRFVANAYYWLGEIYLLQNKLNEAEKAFATVKDNFSGDQKAEDAAYKLGRVYHLQGEDTQAKATLEAVASGNSNTAQLARDYLRDNF